MRLGKSNIGLSHATGAAHAGLALALLGASMIAPAAAAQPRDEREAGEAGVSESMLCPPQEAWDAQIGGLSFPLPAGAAAELTGQTPAAASGRPARMAILSARAVGRADEVASAYRCLLAQAGYGLSPASAAPADPFTFHDGMHTSGQILVAAFPDAAEAFSRIVVIAQIEPAEGE